MLKRTTLFQAACRMPIAPLVLKLSCVARLLRTPQRPQLPTKVRGSRIALTESCQRSWRPVSRCSVADRALLGLKGASSKLSLADDSFWPIANAECTSQTVTEERQAQLLKLPRIGHDKVPL